MAPLQWKPLRWTKWKRKYKRPKGCVLGAPCTCKWYTLSGHHSTSLHSCCCCRAECISQGSEGLWTANGEVGVLYVYRGRLLSKRRRWSGQGLAESRLHFGFISLHKTTFFPFDPPYQQHSFSLLFQLLNKKGLGVGSPIFVWKGEEQRTGGGYWTPESALNAGCSWYSSAILEGTYPPSRPDFSKAWSHSSLLQMGETLEMSFKPLHWHIMHFFLGE